MPLWTEDEIRRLSRTKPEVESWFSAEDWALLAVWFVAACIGFWWMGHAK
jgi:hypothetical protein